MNSKKKAVVLLSGGLDSTTVLAVAKSEGYALYTLSFDYGQRNRFEMEGARQISAAYDVNEHRRITIDLRAFGGSSLTSELPVERNRPLGTIGCEIPSTYVPVRNTLFLTYALAWAEVLTATNIFIGVNALDTSGYPDCRPEFIEAFQTLANLATRLTTEQGQFIRVHAPLQHLTKAEIITLGGSLGVDYSQTMSCYDPTTDGISCGNCDSCTLRKKGFLEANLEDPRVYSDEASLG